MKKTYSSLGKGGTGLGSSLGLAGDYGLSQVYGLSYRYTNLDYQFDTAIIHDHFTANDQGVARGNALLYQFSLSRRIIPWDLPEFTPEHRLDLILDFFGVWQGDREVKGDDVPNTATHFLLLGTGLQYFYSNIVLEGMVSLPLLANFPTGQAEPDITLIGGLRLYF